MKTKSIIWEIAAMFVFTQKKAVQFKSIGLKALYKMN